VSVDLPRRFAAEFLGSGLLLAAVVGSGIMAEQLAANSGALALLANSLSTSAMLAVLIAALRPISGAHFNPAVTLVTVLRSEMSPALGILYALAQLGGAVTGVLVAHLMFARPAIELAQTARFGPGQWLAEGVATFGLVMTVLATSRAADHIVAVMVGGYIASAYWFTASTSFANPAVTVARTLTDSFAGIRPIDAPFFIAAQFGGAVAAQLLCGWLWRRTASSTGVNT
jgi:glycerol uptake facilitator-like aquaporin